jgi:hypothetical protein
MFGRSSRRIARDFLMFLRAPWIASMGSVRRSSSISSAASSSCSMTTRRAEVDSSSSKSSL